MEKVFVHPECPFSENTFKLLAQLYAEGKSPDFLMTDKKTYLKYVAEPLKYILSQVEEQLPDFMKNYLNIKSEILDFGFKTKDEQSPAYTVGLCFHDSDNSSKLILLLQEDRLTFGLCAGYEFVEQMVTNYQNYDKNNPVLINYFKRYNLPTKHQCRLKYAGEKDYSSWKTFERTITDKNSISELLESILKEIDLDSKKWINVVYENIFVCVSLEKSEELLGYSAKQLIYKIAQAFKKLFPLLLISSCDNPDRLTLFDVYETLVFQNEFNPVYQLEEISEITGFQKTQLAQWIHTINRKGQTIIQGPPGTGKTFLAQKIAQHLIGGGDGFSDIIQFHPAYTYEDFIQGIRPQTQDGQLTYPIVPGRFLEFCEKAEAREDTCVLIIDEINRANLSQVFGELMYLLDDRQDTKRFITLASGKLFRIPTNVRIIGTMNTADRSIALVDNALRRRFAFIPVYPNYEVLRQYHHREETGFPVDKLTSILEDVNCAINNKHYELGISFFLTKTLAEDIQDIWQMEIEPYLEEYFFDNLEKMDEFLWKNIKNKVGYGQSNAVINAEKVALLHPPQL
ncbi:MULTISPECIES: AAA family ATPase [unclassified Microcoleus]|uniref:AAA family ATPase n=1 Tax=unclassified Microcoleus TaxID=2642155 RepID=UPI002FD63993